MGLGDLGGHRGQLGEEEFPFDLVPARFHAPGTALEPLEVSNDLDQLVAGDGLDGRSRISSSERHGDHLTDAPLDFLRLAGQGPPVGIRGGTFPQAAGAPASDRRAALVTH